MSKRRRGPTILTYDEFASAAVPFMRRLRMETDEGVALVGSAYLDVLLTQLLAKFFVDDSKAALGLMGLDRPLGSLASKIHLAYLLGLLTKEDTRKLLCIKDIRNDIAHSYEARLADQDIADKCRSLVRTPGTAQVGERRCLELAILTMSMTLTLRLPEVEFSHRRSEWGSEVDQRLFAKLLDRVYADEGMASEDGVGGSG